MGALCPTANRLKTPMSDVDALANSRRDFLRAGLTLVSGVIVPVSLAGCDQKDPITQTQAVQTFVQPTVLEAKSGLLDVTLKASYFDTQISGSKPKDQYSVSLRAYGYDAHPPGYSGPTFVVRGGDTLRIKLINDLPVNPPFLAFRDPSNFVKPNTT